LVETEEHVIEMSNFALGNCFILTHHIYTDTYILWNWYVS